MASAIHWSYSQQKDQLTEETRLTNASPKMNPEKRTLLPKVAFTSFVSRYKPPKIDEGFEDIMRVDFQVSHTPHTSLASFLVIPMQYRKRILTGVQPEAQRKRATESSMEPLLDLGFFLAAVHNACKGTSAPDGLRMSTCPLHSPWSVSRR